MSSQRKPTTSKKVAAKVQSVAHDEFKTISNLAAQSITSRAYLYPFKGILYFVSHRALWKPLQQKLAPLLSLGISVTSAMFLLTYLPQMAVLALFEGPLAAVSAILLVLSESSTIVNFISKGFLVEEALVDTFDGTLLSKNMATLVEPGRKVKSGTDPINKLGKLIKKPFAKYTPTAIIRYFMYLPLNFIPVIGTVLFILAQGRRAGPTAHARYFQLKGLTGAQRDGFVEQRKAAYTAFGVPATLLEMIPVAGIFFSFTNQVGAALWAVDLEAALGKQKGTAPGLRQDVDKLQGEQETGVVDL